MHPLFPNLFIARGLVCNSRPPSQVINSGIGHNTYSRCSEPLFTLFQASNDSLPVWNFSWYFLTCSRLFLRFSSRVTFRHLPRWYWPDSKPCRSPFFQNTPLLCRKYDGVPEERTTTLSWWPETAEWRHQCNGSTSSRRTTKTKNTPWNFVTRTFPLYFPLKSRDEISCTGGELWRPDNQATLNLY